MTHVLYRISRSACPASDRPWLDALFAEMDAVETGRGRLLWLFGALGLLLNRHVQRLSPMVSLTWLACLVAALCFAVMGFFEYEGLAIEDDLYPAFAALAVATLIALSVRNLRRHNTELRL